MLVSSQSLIALAVGAGATLARAAPASRVAARRGAAGRARSLLDEARRDADATRREAAIEAREQAIKLRAELEAELRERRDAVVKIEERVLAKEDDIDAEADRADPARAGGCRPRGCTSGSSRRT